VRASVQLSNREARWLAIAAQGLGGPRPVPFPATGKVPGRAHLRRLMAQVGTIQLDAVNVLARTQFLVPFSRFGSYDPAVMRGLSGPGGCWFEYWGHAASLLPVELQPLFRWRMRDSGDESVYGAQYQQRRQAWRTAHADYLASVLAEVADRGPLAASQLSEPRRQSGEWWDRRSIGRRALEVLFSDGVLAAWRSSTFERIYDLVERVIPPAVLNLPTPRVADAELQLVVLAARCLGVATITDLADYFWLRPVAARARVAELVEGGQLEEVQVEGWGKPAYVVAGSHPRRPRRRHGTLLSPFDSLIWTRERTERLFGFRYRIEIYVPAPRRTYGYYVMPLLLGDELVGRFDLKSDRKGGALMVHGAFSEPGADPGVVALAALEELDHLRQWLGLGDLRIATKGDLAPRLAAMDGGGAPQ
jgi:hypothetical protein